MATYGKSCSFSLPSMSLVEVEQFVCILLSLLVFRVGCGIWLKKFLTIAYLITFHRFGLDVGCTKLI